MNKQEKAEMYLPYLRDHGYEPEIDKDGDIIFKKEKGRYYILVYEDDDEYFQLAYPNFWQIADDDARERALEVCTQVNRSTKVAKLYVTRKGNEVWASAELLLPRPQDFEGVFKRAMSVLQTGATKFLEEIAKPAE
ncbi:MAG TPA: YbjN domain-containing protein [Verrucomicrobiae bacterium]|nr:YbjN domain-containing protein [Verrucomicrobiae bacterium]